MTPKEFVDKYPVGTKFVINTEMFDGLRAYSYLNGIWEYIGIGPCTYKCAGYCPGELLIRKEKSTKTEGHCLSFTTNKLSHDIPIVEIIDDPYKLPDELFEIEI